MAAQPVGSETVLELLNPVLTLPAIVVELKDRMAAALQVGHQEAQVGDQPEGPQPFDLSVLQRSNGCGPSGWSPGSAGWCRWRCVRPYSRCGADETSSGHGDGNWKKSAGAAGCDDSGERAGAGDERRDVGRPRWWGGR